MIRRNETSAFYVARVGKFIRIDPKTWQRYPTSCPHDATLFTSLQAAQEVCDSVNATLPEYAAFEVLASRTHAPNVLTGPGPVPRARHV